MARVQCPRCGLYNPKSAQRCDCGYDFASGEVKTSYLVTEAVRQSTRLKRRSILLMVLLTVVTGGIYYPSWFLLRRDGINSLNANEKLGTLPFVVAIILFVVALGFGIVAEMAEVEEVAGLTQASDLTQLFAGILLLVQCFKVRRIIEAHLHAATPDLSDMPLLRHSQSSLSRVAVFLLLIFYLQYVINKRLAPVAEVQPS